MSSRLLILLLTLLCLVQIPGEMLRQIRYLYENEVRRLNPRSVQKAIKQMQLELMDQQPSRGIITPKVSRLPSSVILLCNLIPFPRLALTIQNAWFPPFIDTFHLLTQFSLEGFPANI